MRRHEFFVVVASALIVLPRRSAGAQQQPAASAEVYGEKVRMAPKFAGFNRIGYLVPFVVIVAAALAATYWIARSLQRQRAMAATAARTMPIPIHATTEELERIDRALKDDSR